MFWTLLTNLFRLYYIEETCVCRESVSARHHRVWRWKKLELERKCKNCAKDITYEIREVERLRTKKAWVPFFWTWSRFIGKPLGDF